LTFAGFSSLIAHLELSTRVLIDAGLKRPRAIIIVTIVIYILGVPSAISLNVLKNQDFVWGYALMISGALAALAVARYGASRLRKAELLADENDWKLGRWWDVILVGFVPLGAMTLLVWWLVKEAQPGTWYNPLDPTSVMNCLVQWFVVLSFLLFIGRWLARRSMKNSPPDIGQD
ncbi:MAG: sodium-dependent transporter, partial [Planctomycetes bacterium]|nr:sodium-dependent transporter [Planctomycetota bacterium]